MFCRYLLNPFGSKPQLVSLCLSSVSVSMTCLLVRLGVLKSPTTIVWVQCMLEVSIASFMNVRVLGNRSSELRLFHGGFSFS